MASIIQPTDGELEILQIIWKLGPSSVRTINDELNKKREVGYTTSLKIMQIMIEKNLLTRNTDNRSHIYSSNIPETKVKTNMLNELIEQAFHGSATQMVLQALGTSKPSKTELDEIKNLIDQIEKNQ